MGARYNISGMIDGRSIIINWVEVAESEIASQALSWHNRVRNYQLIPVKCDIDCFAKDLEIKSSWGRQHHGGVLHGLTPIKITELTLIPKFDSIEDISQINSAVVFQSLGGLNFHINIDGEWSIVAGDDDFSGDVTELDALGYSNFYFNSITMHIANDDAIEILDEYAKGKNYDETYVVTDIDDNDLDSFDDLDDAIDYAKDYNGYAVWSQKEWYTYKISGNGDIYVLNSEVEDNFTKEWINQDYDFDMEDY